MKYIIEYIPGEYIQKHLFAAVYCLLLLLVPWVKQPSQRSAVTFSSKLNVLRIFYSDFVKNVETKISESFNTSKQFPSHWIYL